MLLLLSIISAGLGIFINYVAGSGASGGIVWIVWGLGSNYKKLTGITYVLYMLAGLGLILSYAF